MQIKVTGIHTSNKLRLDAATLQQFPSLRWISRLGSGMEIIDQIYCAQHQIVCLSSPGGIANAVAEHLIGMLLGLLHHIPAAARQVSEGMWLRESNRGHELAALRVGLIGYGHTGRLFAQKLLTFTSPVLVYDKYRKGFADTGIRETDLHTIQKEADIISFHVPLQEDTRHYYNHAFLEQMNKPHILLNTSRGEVVHTPVLLEGLQNGRVKGACLDVLEDEKMLENGQAKNHPYLTQLLSYPVLLTPHIAGYSFEAIDNMSEELRIQLVQLPQF